MRFLFVGVLAFVPFIASAALYQAGEQVAFTGAETVREDVYLAGGSVQITTPIVGDVVAAGGSVTLDGTVSEDAIVAGGTVTIVNSIADDVRVAGGTVVITGDIGGDLVGMSGQMQVSGNTIAGDVLWAGGTLQLNTPVAGDVHIAGGEVFINKNISGDVVFYGDKLTLGDGAVVNGTLTYHAPVEVVMESGASVLGEVSYTQTQSAHNPSAYTAGLVALVSITTVLFFGAFLLFALVLGLGFKRFITELTTEVRVSPFAQLGKGTLTMIALPILSVVLMITVLGFYIGVLGLLAFVGMLLFGSALASIVLGSVVAQWWYKTETAPLSWKTITLGVVLYTLIGIVPFVGWLAQMLLVLASIGGLVTLKWRIVQEWR